MPQCALLLSVYTCHQRNAPEISDGFRACMQLCLLESKISVFQLFGLILGRRNLLRQLTIPLLPLQSCYYQQLLYVSFSSLFLFPSKSTLQYIFNPYFLSFHPQFTFSLMAHKASPGK